MYVVFNKVITICVFKTILAQQALFRATKNIEKKIFNPLSFRRVNSKGGSKTNFIFKEKIVFESLISVYLYILFMGQYSLIPSLSDLKIFCPNPKN